MKKYIILLLCISILASLSIPFTACSISFAAAPEISIDGETVVWSKMQNADYYSLKIMFGDTDGYELTTNETSYKIKFVKKGDYKFSVRAKIGQAYSAYSDVAVFTLEKDINTSKSDDGKVTYRGSGTQDDPILIESATQLLSIKTGTKKQVVNDINETIQLYYKQTCDIDFGGKDVSPICTGSQRFSGFYDGNGHVISNFTQNELPKSGYIYMGLFGSLENASVINLTIKDYSSTLSYVSKGFGWGAIAGYSKLSNIENCHVEGSIEINSPMNGIYYGYAGLLVGESFGSRFERCSTKGEINLVFSKCFAGGLVGATNMGAKDVIDNCVSYATISTRSTGRESGKIETTSYSGGLIGFATSFKMVSNSVADSYLSATAIDGGDPTTIGIGIFGGGKFRSSNGLSMLIYSNCYFNYKKMGLDFGEKYEYKTLEELVNRYAIGGRTVMQNPSTTVFGFKDEQISDANTFKSFDFENVWAVEDGKLTLRDYSATHTVIE